VRTLRGGDATQLGAPERVRTLVGILSIARWAARAWSRRLAIPLVARTVPLLMLFTVVLFLTTEIGDQAARRCSRLGSDAEGPNRDVRLDL
jgi:hypothetical protein